MKESCHQHSDIMMTSFSELRIRKTQYLNDDIAALFDIEKWIKLHFLVAVDYGTVDDNGADDNLCWYYVLAVVVAMSAAVLAPHHCDCIHSQCGERKSPKALTI
ncbi:hypothetical protein GQX74_012808 [Glossina fuscipes]|nr:hypothetical protein GQX74_012808 [Glossina fuscipes]